MMYKMHCVLCQQYTNTSQLMDDRIIGNYYLFYFFLKTVSFGKIDSLM